MNTSTLIPSILIVVALVGDIRAEDWNRFRGPNGSGAGEGKDIPSKWTDKDIVFKIDVPGMGVASPIISKGKLFLHTSAKDGSERSLLCLDSSTGKTIWKKSIPGKPHKIHNKNSLASATPAADGEHVVVPYWDGNQVIVYGYDYSGKELWKYGLGGFESQHGAGSSPIIDDGKVYILHDQDKDKAQNKDRASVLVCLDVKTGKKVWEKTRGAIRACYAAPIIQETGGKKELIIVTTASISSYNAADGKLNWNIDGAFNNDKLRAVGTPVLVKDMLIASTGNGEGDRNTVAVKTNIQAGDTGKASVSWSITKRSLGAYVPSVLVKDDYLYWVTDKGDAACVSARDGKEIWFDKIGEAFTASPLLIDDRVFTFGEKGSVYVFKATSAKYEQLAKNDAGEAIMATPALADGKLYIRTRTQLICIGKK